MTEVRRQPAFPALTEPDDVLRWAFASFGVRIGLLSALGPQSCVLVERLHALRLPIRVILLDTGLLFPETLALADRLEAKYQIPIERFRPLQTVDQQAEVHGPELWRRDPDRCCALRKVEPLERALAPFDAWITGLRRDQSDARASTETIGWDPLHQRVKVNPLAHWTRARTLAWLRERQIPYHPLLDRGFPSVGCVPCTRSVRPGLPERAGRWPDAPGKTECGLHVRPTPAAPEEP